MKKTLEERVMDQLWAEAGSSYEMEYLNPDERRQRIEDRFDEMPNTELLRRISDALERRS